MPNAPDISVTLPGSWAYASYQAPHERTPRTLGAVTLILACPESIPQATAVRQALEIEGNSHVAICRPAVDVDSPNRSLTFQTFIAGGQLVTFKGDANSQGYLGKLHLSGLALQDLRACEFAALQIMQPSINLLSYNNDVPIFIWQIHIAPAGSNKTFVRMPEPFTPRRNGNRQDTFPQAFAQIIPAYREALNLVQVSPLLSFILFYRVIEATTALRRSSSPTDASVRQRVPAAWPDICSWLSDILNYARIDILGAHEVVPEDAVGRKYSWIITEKLRTLRNRIAHGLIDEGDGNKFDESGRDQTFSSLDDLQLQLNVQTWLPLCHVIARAALRDVGGLENTEFGQPLDIALQERAKRGEASANPQTQ